MELKLHTLSLKTFPQRKLPSFLLANHLSKDQTTLSSFTIFSLEMRKSATALGLRRPKTKTVFTGRTGRRLVQSVCVSGRGHNPSLNPGPVTCRRSREGGDMGAVFLGLPAPHG